MTEVNGIPDHRCGFTLDSYPLPHLLTPPDQRGDVCCWRKTWRDTDRCVWHAEIENKPVEELKAARADSPERLDGAYLAGVKDGNELSFYGCVLRSAIFSAGDFSRTQFHDATLDDAEFYDVTLSHAEFCGADLSRTEFRGADLSRAEFHDVDLSHAEFHDANLSPTEFHDAALSYAEFHNADLAFGKFYDAVFHETEFHDTALSYAEFHNADLDGGEFYDVTLEGAEFPEAYLGYAKFHDADLRRTEFRGADLRDAEFHNANLRDTDCTDAVARRTNFTHSTLHDAILTRADCRGATFTSALLYETVFADTRINSQTTFHDPEATFYDSITSRPAVVYEENPFTAEDLPKDTHPLEAAEWVYRRLEKIHDENALSEQAREYHISKEEARRKYQRESEEYARYAVSTLQWWVTGHGESIPRIFRSAALLIALFVFVLGRRVAR